MSEEAKHGFMKELGSGKIDVCCNVGGLLLLPRECLLAYFRVDFGGGTFLYTNG